MVVVTELMGNKLSRKQRSLLSLAAKMAVTSELAQKHGAVIVKNGRVLSLGVNKQKNADIVGHIEMDDPAYFTVHAEMDAINRCANPAGATIYIARVGKNGEERYSRPCENCARIIAQSGIRTAIYTITEN